MSYIKYPIPTAEQFRNFSSETAKYRHLTAHYCAGCGVDIASQGDTVVPWAISYDLPTKEFMHYSGGHAPKGDIHLRGFADRLPFESDSLSWAYSSHLIEDYKKEDRARVINEWVRVVKHGGVVIILAPEVERWNYAIRVLGQAPNCSHSAPEPSLGDFAIIAKQLGCELVEERLTDVAPHDYSILAVLRKP